MRLSAISSCTASEPWSAKRMTELIDAEESFIAGKVGVETKYILKEDESGIDLAERAVDKLFEKTGKTARDIDFMIYVTQTPEYRIPQNSALLHDRLGLRSDCGAFDLSLACSGWVYSLMTARAIGLAEGFSNILLVTCDPYSKVMDPRDKGTAAVFGDGAAATLLVSDDQPGYAIGKGDYGTAGDRYQALIIPAGGAAKPLRSWHSDGVQSYSDEESRLHMKGREVFNFVQKEVPGSIQRCLYKNELELGDIGMFALHQGSKYMLTQMAKRLGIPDGKLAVNIEKYGNTVSSSVPMVLEEVLDGVEDIKPAPILVSGFGVGLSWATNVIWTDR